MKESIFIKQNCKLVLNNNFVLYGIVDDMDAYGIIFRTDQKTGYHSFSNIKELTLGE